MTRETDTFSSRAQKEEFKNHLVDAYRVLLGQPDVPSHMGDAMREEIEKLEKLFE